MSQRLLPAGLVTMVIVVWLGLGPVGAGATPSIEVDTAVGQVCEVPPAADVRMLAERLARLSGAVTALTARVRSLAPRLDEALGRDAFTALSVDVATLARRVADLSAQLVERDREPRAPAALPVPAPPSHDRRSSTTPASRDLYRAAYVDFSRGNYALAIGAFREFVRRYPDDGLADNAAYWVAEAYFSLAHRYQDAGEVDRAAHALGEAVQAFREVVERYPWGDKAPTALYREALALLERQEPALARARLRSLVERFPRAPEARLARHRLAPADTR